MCDCENTSITASSALFVQPLVCCDILACTFYFQPCDKDLIVKHYNLLLSDWSLHI